MNKQKNPDENREIKITDEDSSLAEFTKRRVPTDKEVEEFEDYINEEAKDGEIDESLNEIYQDDKGNMVDVKKLEIKKRRSIFFRFVQFIFVLGLISTAVYGAYYYLYLKPGLDVTAVEFRIEAPAEILSGEAYTYSIYYKNLSNVAISSARIEVQYPDSFINLSTVPPASGDKSNVWEIPLIAPKYSGMIKIKGKIIGPKDKSGIIIANFTYKPESLSSEFKKESSFTSMIKDVGLDFDFDYVPNSLVGETNDITLRYSAKEKNYLNNFRLTFITQENIEFVPAPMPEAISSSSVTMVRPGVWQINDIKPEVKTIPIKFKFTQKVNAAQDIQFDFEATGPDNAYYKFYEQKLPYEVMKNDLNLTLIMNGSRDNSGIEFGQTLNYSVVYANKGDSDMKDVVVMVVLEGGLTDWNTVKDDPKGKRRGNTLVWSKEEIPGLAEFKQGQEGTIDFSVDVIKVDNIEPGRDYQVKSYATFSVGEADTDKSKANEDNRSNTITSQINSDVALKEAVRYFSEDNIPVGTGPHPPLVGQTTSYKVYWVLSNSLHELSDLSATVKLPDYVFWSGRENFSVGSLSYNNDTREVTWSIGRLPITVMQANAEFSISITPGENDFNTIMVLLPGSTAKAVDTLTAGNIEKTTKAETTKLENDDIAVGDGIVGR